MPENTEIPVCPECGRAPVERRPRRPLLALRVSLVLVCPLTLIGVLAATLAWSGVSGPSAFAGSHVSRLHLISYTDTDFHWNTDAPRIERRFMRTWFVDNATFVVVPLVRPIELVVTTIGTAPKPEDWVETDLTVGDFLDPALKDQAFARRIEPHIVAAFGEDWDTPDDQYVMLRTTTDFGLSGSTAYLGQYPQKHGRFVAVNALRPARDVDEPFRWSTPWFDWGHTVRVRAGSARAGGPIYTLETDRVSFLAGSAALVASALAPWILLPPLWTHRRRVRWFKRGRCTGCGYPLSPSA